MRFGDYLKSKRKQRNITQEDLARSLNVSSVFVHQLETGKVDAPSLERCQQISSILKVTIEELWTIAFDGCFSSCHRFRIQQLPIRD